MNTAGRHEALIRQLSNQVPPVRRLASPPLRALMWLALSAAAIGIILIVNGPALIVRRLANGPDEMLEFVASALTAGLASLAALTLAIPGRSAKWALLPVPTVLLWLGGAGWGCMRSFTAAADHAPPPLSCFRFIVMMSIPLSLVLFGMLRRSFVVRPGLTAGLAGLAAAAASAVVLDFIHPFGVSVLDFTAHVTAVLLVIVVNRLFSSRALRRPFTAAILMCSTVIVAQAEPVRPVVIELYTSQGCSSCPPADALLSEFARTRPDLLPLAFHVDYWNRLGWNDPFSSPSYSARERLHASRLGEDTIYTPEMVIDGARAVVGSDRASVEAAIRAAQHSPVTLATVSVRRSGSELLIAIGPGMGTASVLLVGFDPAHTTSIGRGENGGRTLMETNVVRSFDSVGKWNGNSIEIRRPAPAGERVAVLLEEANGQIVGSAAEMRR